MVYFTIDVLKVLAGLLVHADPFSADLCEKLLLTKGKVPASFSPVLHLYIIQQRRVMFTLRE